MLYNIGTLVRLKNYGILQLHGMKIQRLFFVCRTKCSVCSQKYKHHRVARAISPRADQVLGFGVSRWGHAGFFEVPFWFLIFMGVHVPERRLDLICMRELQSPKTQACGLSYNIRFVSLVCKVGMHKSLNCSSARSLTQQLCLVE